MTKKNKLNEKFELTFSIRSIAYYFLCIYLIYVFKVTSPGNMTHLGIYMASCFIGAFLLGIEKMLWTYKYGQDVMFNLGKLWGIKNEGLLWVVKSLNTGLLICKYVLPIIGSLIGLALFMKYVPEINNVEILLRLLAIIIVFLYSIYKLFNYLKKI